MPGREQDCIMQESLSGCHERFRTLLMEGSRAQRQERHFSFRSYEVQFPCAVLVTLFSSREGKGKGPSSVPFFKLQLLENLKCVSSVVLGYFSLQFICSRVMENKDNKVPSR